MKVLLLLKLISKFSVKAINILLSDLASLCMQKNLLMLAQGISPRISKHRIKNILSSTDCTKNLSFIPSLNNSRIVLIGPGFSGSSSNFINKFDIVARIGFTGDSSFASDFSNRCNLSFLAKWHADSLAGASTFISENLKNTHFLLRSDVTNNVVKKLKMNFSVSLFPVEPSQNLFGRVVPNFAPQIIMWLLSQRPAELHITHIDLFTDPRRPKGYATNKKVIIEEGYARYSKQQMQQSFSQHHNPFTHFSFFKSLRSITSISYSVKLNQIIDDGLSDYRRKLKQIHY